MYLFNFKYNPRPISFYFHTPNRLYFWLKHYHKHCDEINHFHDFVDNLIELEEQLVEKMKDTVLM